MTTMATPNLLDVAVLRNLAVQAAKAGPIDQIALLVGEGESIRRFGPFTADGSAPEHTHEALLVDGSEPIPLASLPARPTCIANPSDDVTLVRALRACGINSFTLIPLVDGQAVLGALVLGHPAGGAPEQTVVTNVEPLRAIGLHLGTAIVLRRLADAPAATEENDNGEQPPGLALNADAMRAIAMTGRLASLGTLAGGLVHEVNNPATFIALAGGQIEKFVAKVQANGCEGLEPVAELATGIRESTDQIRDMVAAFRLLVGVANESVVVTVDLERVLKSAVELARAAHRHDAVLETDLQQMPSCPGNYVKLGPVLVNVLVNAIESLRTTSSPKKVRVEGRVRDDVIQVRIRDTGEGIAASALPRVFEPFFTTRDRCRHAGLGLTIAREAVAALDGRIDIESELGKGTTVRINVPVRQATSED
jgi:signal transduction histidine kinase